MIMKQNITNFGGGSKTYLRPEVTATEVVVETGFAASEAFPGGNAKPFKCLFYYSSIGSP